MCRVYAFWAETEKLRVRDVGLCCVSIKQEFVRREGGTPHILVPGARQ